MDNFKKYWIGILRFAWYHHIFALDEANSLSVYAIQNAVNTDTDYLISGLSIIPFVGKVLDL